MDADHTQTVLCTSGRSLNFDTALISRAILIIAIVLGAVRPGHAQPGLVGHWPLDGGAATDVSGNSNHGTIFGATPIDGVGGAPNTALRFVASDSQVVIPGSPSLHAATGLTVSAWIRHSSASGGALVSKYNSNQSRNDWAFWPVGNNLGLFVSRNSLASDFGWNRYTAMPALPTDGWTFMVATYRSDPPEIRMYVDGEDSSGNYAGDVVNLISMTSEPIRIGNAVNMSGNLSSFNGDIDDVRMFDRALSESEIRCLYLEYQSAGTVAAQSASAPPCPGGSVTFSVQTLGHGPLNFAWRHSGTELTDGPTELGAVIGGAWTSTLTISNVQPSDAGIYDCLISNGCGAVASGAASLNVACSCQSISQQAGLIDSFSQPPDPASPSPALADAWFNLSPRPLLNFDMIPNVTPGATSDRVVAHTFVGLPTSLVSASITFRVRAGGSDQQSAEGSDSMRLGFASGTGSAAILDERWRRFFGTGNTGDPGFFMFPWRIYTSHPECDHLITLDLSSLPLAGTGTLDLLPEIRAHGYVDFSVSDDSGVDYAELTGTTSDGRTAAWCSVQPPSVQSCTGATVSLAATTGGTWPLSVQWRRGGSPLTDGPTNSGSIISGSASAVLQITGISTADVGAYDCIVANSCSTASSNAVTIGVFPSGSGDGNGDLTVNGLEIQGFVSALLAGGSIGAGYCAFDMNHDGSVGVEDVPVFAARLLGL